MVNDLFTHMSLNILDWFLKECAFSYDISINQKNLRSVGFLLRILTDLYGKGKIVILKDSIENGTWLLFHCHWPSSGEELLGFCDHLIVTSLSLIFVSSDLFSVALWVMLYNPLLLRWKQNSLQGSLFLSLLCLPIQT